MKTIELTVKNVRKAFKEADEKGRKLLRNLCGEDVFSSSITDRVRSYEDACEELDIPVRENWEGLEKD
ncbi:hypothetical protein [Parabacteroides sp. Marseille-P3160]|uniref:hypothetical protein n=1 Tax=Parabacteroides sp. Marseille-P3160 TaxID=1917887 RepID=UPI0009B9C6D4|nr:hypothetical protein [Parabacteroides sp. Marseille-P3160]